MGVCGYSIVAFHPKNESVAIATVTGIEGGSQTNDWYTYTDLYNVCKEDYIIVNRMFEIISENDSSLLPISKVMLNDNAIFLGAMAFYIFRNDDIMSIVRSFEKIDENKIRDAILQLKKENNPSSELWNDEFDVHVISVFNDIKEKMNYISENKWHMIGILA
jgi:hypothetical protein